MSILSNINNSKYFAGFMILVLNLGSRFVAMELSENQEQLLSNIVIRRFVIFTMLFVSTKDIYVSIILTAAFIVLVSGLFNENSKYCIIKKPYVNQITIEDYQHAVKVIKLYEMQKKSLDNI